MLYDSTKSLLQSILFSLETVDETRWEDRTESGNTCLYEMHQMSGSLYKAYRTDRLNACSAEQVSLPAKLNRAMPHARTMVIAIRHKDQTTAIESGKAALAEMNGIGLSLSSGHRAELRTEGRESPIMVGQQATAVEHRRVVKGRRSSSGSRASSGK